MRFEKCFNHKDYPNIFLVSFPSSGLKKMGCVKIVGILDDFSKITILNTFDYDIGLINAIEIKLNDNYYLLNCTNGFTLWFYDSNKNEIKYKRIIPKESNIDNKDDNNDTYKNFITYKKVFYIEKRNLLIAQVHLKSKILFYSINNENNEFNIIFQSQIDIDNETGNYFSDYHLNSCIIQDKYLLIGTKIKKEKKKNNNNNINIEDKNIKKSGIFIVNLDTKKIQMEYIQGCHMVNGIIPFKGNMFVCNYEFLDSRGINLYQHLVLKKKMEKSY